MEWSIALIFTCFAVFLCFLFWYWKDFGTKHLPPGPIGLPVIGYLHKIGKKDLFRTMSELATIYGDIFSVQLGSYLYVVLNSRDAIQETYVKKSKEFSGRPKIPLVQLMGDLTGYFATNVTPQYRENKLLTIRAIHNLFADKNHFDSLLHTQISKLFRNFDSYIKNDSAFDPSIEFDFAIPCVFSTILYGAGFDCDDPHFNKEINAVKLSSERLGVANYLQYFSSHKFLKLIPSRHAQELYWRAQEAYRQETDMFKYSLHMVKKYKECEEKSLLKFFLQHYRSQKIDLTDDILMELGCTFKDLSLGGFETTAATLGWTVLYLALNPKVKKRCQEEISSVVGEANLSIKHEESLPYLAATIYDVLRLSSVDSLGLPHETTCNVNVRSFIIPKGTIVLANQRHANHDPSLWKNPDDLFPEHFLTDDGKLNMAKVNDIVTFSVGSRRCPGDKLAFRELFLIVGSMVKKYDLKLVSPPVDMLPDVGAIARTKPYTVSFARCFNN